MRSLKVKLGCVLVPFLLGGCAAGVGVSIPIGHGVSIGIGGGTHGSGVGITANSGPFSSTVGVNQSGQVYSRTGVGAGVPVGPATVGAGVGFGGILYDPKAPKQPPAPVAGASAP